MPGKAVLLLIAALVALAWPCSAAIADDADEPRASFSHAPEEPRVGEEVVFTSTSEPGEHAIAAQSWDLDDDGEFDDAEGATAATSFDRGGEHRVRLRIRDAGGATDEAEATLRVRGEDDGDGNAPPSASFTMSPDNPVAGDTVTFTSTASDPDGRIESRRWDLDGDGAHDDARGATATRSFPDAGSYTVGLRVVDDKGAWASSFVTFTVTAPPSPPPAPGAEPPPPAAGPSLLSPFPVIRIAGRTTGRGARLSVLSVKTAPGATVAVRCSGRGCPWARRSYKTGERGTKRIRALQQRHLRAGTEIVIRVTTPGTIGKYTRFRIRRKRAPLRSESCLMPGAAKPSPCPAA